MTWWCSFRFVLVLYLVPCSWQGLGVENLRGSGEIAGETSLAYDSNFTLTVVSCRTVRHQKMLEDTWCGSCVGAGWGGELFPAW